LAGVLVGAVGALSHLKITIVGDTLEDRAVDRPKEIVLQSLVLEATGRRDALRSKEALSLNRLDGFTRVRRRLVQVFGEGNVVSGFI